ncbi:MAG: hypothetical protein JSV11_05445 [Nitrospiraceae bacterium]|nr:MAG: hypothetical protein JSV11_05445 [Nitrospiraceae bacterium]
MEEVDVVNGCIKVENSVASLYSKLMEVFPENKAFWEVLLNDEREHIAFLTDVKAQGLISEMEKMDLPPSMKLIQSSLKMVDKAGSRISDEPITMKNALKLALKIEESLVEIYTNEMIANLLSCEDGASYAELKNDEKKHVDRIRKEMKKTK